MNPLQDAMKAVRRTPTDPEAWLALGALLVAEGEPERARDCFERALILDPANDEAQRALRALDGATDDAGIDDHVTGLDDLDLGAGLDDRRTALDDLDLGAGLDDRRTTLDDLDLGAGHDDLGFDLADDEPPFQPEDELAAEAPTTSGAASGKPRLQGAARLWAALGLVGLGAFLCLCSLLFLIALFLRG